MEQANAANGCTAGCWSRRATAENLALIGPTVLPAGTEPPPLAHPAKLASQLLAGTSLETPAPAQARRTGRSTVRRRLPPRGGEADYATTCKDESPASRKSLAHRTGEEGRATSLHGVAPVA